WFSLLVRVAAFDSLVLLFVAAPVWAQAPSPAPDSSAPPAAQTPPPKTDNDGDPRPARLFGVLPNYGTVDARTPGVPPITPTRAFAMAAQNSFDPYVYPFVGVAAALAPGQGLPPGLHRHQTGDNDSIRAFILRRYPIALADNTIGNFLTTAVLPSV